MNGLRRILHLVGLVYCIEFLLENIDWLKEKLEPHEKGEPRADMQQMTAAAQKQWDHKHIAALLYLQRS